LEQTLGSTHRQLELLVDLQNSMVVVEADIYMSFLVQELEQWVIQRSQ
jgi:hypothetical protein